MDKAELGKKIKEARLAKKLTQSEVVGGFITRNMLSQIESGAASPSLKTLEFLSRVLEIPMSELIPSESEQRVEENDEAKILIEAKRLFNEGDLKGAAQNAEKLRSGVFRDEGCAIAAKCYIRSAEDAQSKGDLQQAAELARLAEELASQGVYSSKEILTQTALLMDKIRIRLKTNDN